MEEKYYVKQIGHMEEICVQVPGSKSITNRALLLAALSTCQCTLSGVLFSDDSRAFLDCLLKLKWMWMKKIRKHASGEQAEGFPIPMHPSMWEVQEQQQDF